MTEKEEEGEQRISQAFIFSLLTQILKGSISLVAQRLKCVPAVQETWVRSLSWEDPLEKEIATHSSILAWEIPWREEPGGLQSIQAQRDTTKKLNTEYWKTPAFLLFEYSQQPLQQPHVCIIK